MGAKGQVQVSAASFTGEHVQRIDAKGRVSIPADFRRVLERGDPAWTDGLTPWLRLVYGDNIGQRLDVRTVAGHQRIVDEIEAFEPLTEEEEVDHEAAQHFQITQTQAIEVDRDGRIVLPVARRQKLGLTEGEVVFAGKGDHFQVWAAAAYEEQVSARMREYLADKPRNFNPLTRLRVRRG